MKTFRTPIALLLMILLMSASLAIAGDLDRTKRPVAKPVPSVQLPAIEKKTLSNGLQVWLVERHELPMVAFNLVIQAGSDHDPVAMPGLASMTAAIMDEGTKTRSSLEIADEIESIGASLNASSGTDGSSVAMSTLKKHLDKALDVFTDVITNPTFPDKDFERIRKQRLTVLIQQRDQPVAIANNAFGRILYTDKHPYGNNPGGTEASLHAMTPADLKKFYSTYYVPNNAVLIVVGDALMSDVVPQLEKATASWKQGSVPAFTLPEAPPPGKRRIYLIDKPGAAQSEFRIGYPSAPRSTPDYFALREMNQMLGGQFTSRINLNLREKHGYTYGARSAFSFFKGPAPFIVSGGIVTEKTDSALIEFLHELTAMRTGGMTSDELAFVKKGLVGNFALAFETSSQIAGQLQGLVLYGLPDDYFRTYLQQTDAVKLDDITRVCAKYLDEDKMAVVIVGDLAKIRAGIEKLNLGEIVVCDVDGNPVK